MNEETGDDGMQENSLGMTQSNWYQRKKVIFLCIFICISVLFLIPILFVRKSTPRKRVDVQKVQTVTPNASQPVSEIVKEHMTSFYTIKIPESWQIEHRVLSGTGEQFIYTPRSDNSLGYTLPEIMIQSIPNNGISIVDRIGNLPRPQTKIISIFDGTQSTELTYHYPSPGVIKYQGILHPIDARFIFFEKEKMTYIIIVEKYTGDITHDLEIAATLASFSVH